MNGEGEGKARPSPDSLSSYQGGLFGVTGGLFRLNLEFDALNMSTFVT